LLVPGLLDGLLPSIQTSSGTVIEANALASEQFISATTVIGGGTGCGEPAGPPPSGPPPVGYVNPFRNSVGLVAERIDQGVDYSGQGQIDAIGDGTIEFSQPASPYGWPGNWYLAYKLDPGGIEGGKWIYIAEDITPVRNWQKGDHVSAGEPLVTFGPNEGDGIEIGWAQPDPGFPGAYAHSQYHEGDRTAAGQDFSNFLQLVGAPPGCIEGRPIVGTYP
jgi:hypothetical protein